MFQFPGGSAEPPGADLGREAVVEGELEARRLLGPPHLEREAAGGLRTGAEVDLQREGAPAGTAEQIDWMGRGSAPGEQLRVRERRFAVGPLADVAEGQLYADEAGARRQGGVGG
jgi:hypothetical protein